MQDTDRDSTDASEEPGPGEQQPGGLHRHIHVYEQARRVTRSYSHLDEVYALIAAEKSDEELRRLETQLRALHRLDACLDLDPEDRLDLMRLSLERSVVLTLDGGGFHIFWSLQLLRELEASIQPEGSSDLRLCDVFDVIAGSSAGAITATLICSGWSVADIEEKFWLDQGRAMWPYRNPFVGLGMNLLGRLGLRLSQYLSRIMLLNDAPLHAKKKFRDWAKEQFGDMSMGELCERNRTGLFLISKNTRSGYTVPAGVLLNPFRRDGLWFEPGHDKILVRGALEASCSPPMFMQPLGQYIDGGAGSDNDPTMLVLRKIYGLRRAMAEEAREKIRTGEAGPGGDEEDVAEMNLDDLLNVAAGFFFDIMEAIDDGRMSFRPKKETVVFSFSTSNVSVQRTPTEIIHRPTLPLLFWSYWFIQDFYLGSSTNHVRLLTDEKAFPGLDYRRFQLTLGTVTLRNSLALGPFDEPFEQIPGITGTSTATVSEEDLFYLRWLLDADFIPFYRAVGRATVAYLKHRARRLEEERQDLGDLEVKNKWKRDRQFRIALVEALSRALDAEKERLDRLQRETGGDAYERIELKNLLVNALFSVFPREHVKNHRLTLDELDGSILVIKDFLGGLHIDDVQWEDIDAHLGRFYGAVCKRALLNYMERSLNESESESGTGPRRILEGLRRIMDEMDTSFRVDGPESVQEKWSEIAGSTAESLRNVFKEHVLKREVRLAPRPPRPFARGLQGQLLDYETNLYAEEQREAALLTVGRELELTLGAPRWLDDQPPDEPRQGAFALTVPTFKPPLFQDADHPLTRLNPFQRHHRR